ncbi:MAG: hypothetical protein ACKO7P_12645 [Bacteroidota bacterium]
MSLQLLKYLNRGKKGLFNNWLQEFKSDPRIAWYPSAGVDFRPLMFLHPLSTSLVSGEPDFPEIFLFTDYFPWTDSKFLDSPVIYKDLQTEVSVTDLEQLSDLHIPLDPEVVHFPDGSHATNKVIFMKIKITSRELGTIYYPVLYAFVQNESFYSSVLEPYHARISHIIHVRYGGGMGGGGSARGTWILHVLAKLHTQELIADNHDIGLGVYNSGPGDEFFLRKHPSLPKMPYQNLQAIRTTQGEQWSNYGDVIWYLVQ